MKKTLLVACTTTVAFLFCHVNQAAPLRYTSRPDELALFPHSLCNSDFICTGTPTSTNDGNSAEFAVDEILWGAAPSTNVTMQYFVTPEERYKFQLGERYLVCAFTNDWWSVRRPNPSFEFTNDWWSVRRTNPSFEEGYVLSQCVTETNRPPNNAIFEKFVVLDNRRGAIPFKHINYGGTNYWDKVRTFATNIIYIAKHEGDDDKVRSIVLSILADRQKREQFPAPIVRNFILYKFFFCEGIDEPQP